MTKSQTTAEMKYRLSKYILQILLNAAMITVDEAVKSKEILCEKYATENSNLSNFIKMA